jgi:predicted glycoside hydrolase/deacetylase ChbG (UPF0249 family)
MGEEKTQISKVRNAKGEIKTNTTIIQEIVRDYNKFENFGEMNRFLDIYNHPKLNPECINHINRFITQNEIEATIVSQKKKSPGPDEKYSVEFYQTFKEELIPTLLKLFHEIQRERTLLNLFYEAKITLITKAEKNTSIKENYRSISSMNSDAKILNKIMQTKSYNTSER